MPAKPATLKWKRAARLVEPSVTADSSISGAALTILLTGLEACLQGSDAPMVAARVAALVGELELPRHADGLVMRQTVRGFSRVRDGGSVTVVVIAGGRPTVLAPIPDEGGTWYEEFDIPLAPASASTYPITVVVSSARQTVKGVACGGVDSLDLLLTSAASTTQPEEDPAAPETDADFHDAPLASARAATNFGVEAEPVSRPTRARAVGAATMPSVDIAKANAFLQACISSSPRVTYGLGAKLPRHGAVPGRDFRKVDCSGFVRELIWLATTPQVNFPDGSVVQHEWVQARQLPKSAPAEATAADGVVRIAFLRPQDSPSGIGHVVLVHNGRTLESHGGVGPNSRPWTGAGWQAKARVYAMSPLVA
jgi:hypothetical protein